MPDTQQKIDKQRARRAFGRAANTYDEVAVLQREIGSRILDRLQLVRLQPERILDLGAGTGVDTRQLMRRYSKASVCAMDFALPMLRRTRQRGSWFRRAQCLCGDMEQLPIASASVDLIFSNLALQWVNDLDAVFRECRRILKPGGLLMFSTFGPDTLKELRSAWARVDNSSHVSSFLDMHDIGDMLLHNHFADPVMDVERLTVTYQAVDDLMRDLKYLGAGNATAGSVKGLTGKARMNSMRQAYESYRREGQLPASYEVVYGHAWIPEQEQQPPGNIAVPVDSIKLPLGKPID